MGWQRVEDGGLLGRFAVAQRVLRAPQQERPALGVRYRVHLASRQLLEALAARVQRRDQRGNFRIGVLLKVRWSPVHAARISGFSSPRARSTGPLWLRVPTILRMGDGPSLRRVGVMKMASSSARFGSWNTSTISMTWRSRRCA